jgi:hypothetical protein
MPDFWPERIRNAFFVLISTGGGKKLFSGGDILFPPFGIFKFRRRFPDESDENPMMIYPPACF